MNEFQSIMPLTEEDRKELQRNGWLRLVTSVSKDLEENQKIREIGQIVAIRANKYISKITFQPRDGSVTREFSIRGKSVETSDELYQAYHLKKEVAIEYTSHSQFLLHIQLLVPLTPKEEEDWQKTNWTGVTILFILIGAFLLSLGWLFDILFFMFPVYLGFVLLVIGFIWWSKQNCETK